MKYLLQFGIITAICFVSELLHILIPLPVPASVYGLVILFLLLLTGSLKVSQIEDVSAFFMAILPVLFVSPSVSLITSADLIMENLLALIMMMGISTIAVIVVTGRVSQGMIRRKLKKEKTENAE